MAWNPNVSTARTPARPNAQPSRTFKHSNTRTLFLVVIALVVLAALWFIFGRDRSPSGPQTPTAETPKKLQMVDVEVHVATNKPPPAPPNAVAEKPMRVPTAEEQKKLRPGDPGFNPAAHPTVWVPKNPKNPPPNLPFKSGVEQALAWIVNCEPGDAPLPLLPIPPQEMEKLAEILIAENKSEEGDGEDTKRQRELITLAKAELRKYVANGGDPQEFLKYYHDMLEQQYEERQEAQNAVMTLLRNSDNDDIAADYVKKVNARLAEKGIKPVVISKKKMAKHGIVLDENKNGGDDK